MNAKKCRMLRRAADYRIGRPPTTYEQGKIHHLAEMPTYEQYDRVVRTMGKEGYKFVVLSWTVTKIAYLLNGKTPRKILINAKGLPEMTLVPIGKPAKLKAGSPRKVYKTLKQLERRVGLDNAFKSLAADEQLDALNFGAALKEAA